VGYRILLAKNESDVTAQNGGPNTERCLPLIRYAEILMNYAEASNETGNIAVAYDQLKLIRKRAGILRAQMDYTD
jgi:hypothetical protein